MTFLEKLERDGEFAHRVRDMRSGLFTTCPEDYGYEPPRTCNGWDDCRDCWNREAPEEAEKDLKEEPIIDRSPVIVLSAADVRNIQEGRGLTLVIDGEVFRATKIIVGENIEPGSAGETDVKIRFRYGGKYGE